jgi:predicted ester cyclase
MADSPALVQRVFDEVINAGNLDVIDDVFAENFLDHGPFGDVPGREAFRDMVGKWRAAVPDVHCEVQNLITEGDTVAWLVHTTGTHTGDDLGIPATGKSFETISANVARFRDGLCVEHWAEQGMLSMFVQLGLFAMPGS